VDEKSTVYHVRKSRKHILAWYVSWSTGLANHARTCNDSGRRFLTRENAVAWARNAAKRSICASVEVH
jgi:hypothetical protein